ncbi:MAG: hypothetical protein JSW50_02160 [Candidatus Latescibacterota bacterium]|nr:MAG: hypothetical protein JSW50_02160 [Candidatus Latescibacterota bacterium]
MLQRFFPRAIVFVAVVMLTAGCKGSYHVNTDHLDDGTTVTVMQNNELKVEGALKFHAESLEGNYTVEKQLFLDLRKIQKLDEQPIFAFLMEYIGTHWLKIEKGRSLELVVDGRSFYFSGEGEVRREMDPSGDSFSEKVDYPVDSDFLIRLAQAESVEVIVNGHDGEIAGYFDSVNFGNVRRFVADHVPQVDRGY